MEINLKEFDVLKNELNVETKECLAIENQENQEYIATKNEEFDKKLIDANLLEFERRGDCIDGRVSLYHKKCKDIIDVNTQRFFRVKHKCPVCAKKKNRKKKIEIFNCF